MSDFERYGDYNATEDEEEGRAPSAIGKVLKIGVTVLLLSVCLILVGRLLISGYYPRSMRKLYMTDSLKAYAAVSKLRVEEMEIDDDFRFDSSDFASFCADNLFIERGAGAMQLSVRMTDGTFEELSRRLSLSPFKYSGHSSDYFEFSLVDSLGNRYRPEYVRDDSYLWYHAVKLCYSGIDFASLDAQTYDPGEDAAADDAYTVYLDSWVRLEVYYTAGGEPDYSAKPYAVMLVYMNIADVLPE